MDEDANKLEHVFLARFIRVAKIFDIIWADVDLGWELKLVVDFGSPHVHQVKVEAFEVEDEVVGDIL